MPTRPLALAVSALLPTLFALPLPAQHSGRGASTPSPATAPSREASQFDFLVGQWELVVTPKVSSLAARIHGAPKFLGTWKGWKTMDGFGVEDELRIMDRSGNPSTLLHSLRLWSPSEQRWLVSAADAYRARLTTAAARWDGSTMTTSSGDAGTVEGPVRTRSRFSAITPTTFRFEQDRSEDGGKTWNERALVIEAKRVSATAPR